MAARCDTCGYHLEPLDRENGFRGCLVCERNSLRARCKRLERALDETHALVTNLGARVLRDVVGLDGTDQELVADILRDHVNDVYGRAKAARASEREVPKT